MSKFKKPANKNFDMEYQYQQYLKRVNLQPENMHPQQRIQLRQAFYGAIGQLLVLQREEISPLPEPVAVGVLENMEQQVAHYWIEQAMTGGH